MAQKNRQHGRNIQKPKSLIKSTKRLLDYSKKYMPIVIFAIICSMAGSILSVLGPDHLKDMANHIATNMFTGIDLAVVSQIGLTLVAIYTTSVILSILQNIIMARVSHKISRNVRSDLSRKINKLPIGYIDHNSTGDIMSRITNDSDQLSRGLSNGITTLASATTMLLASTFMMFKTDWRLALTAIGSSLVGFIFMAIIISISEKYYMAQQQELGRIDGHIEEVFSAHDIVNVYNATAEKTGEFEVINKKLYNAVWKAEFFGGLMPSLMNFIGNLGFVAVCVVGAVLASSGKISIGTIVAFIIYVRLFLNPLNQIAQGFSTLQSAGAASERVFELLDQKELEDESYKTAYLSPEDVKGKVDFNDICFGYSPDKETISHFTMHIKPGQKVAIVGPTGAGKTTIVNLLMRFYELNSGDICIDDIKTSDLTRDNIHNLFGMVLQDTWLFDGTIRENLVYDKENVSDETLNKIIDACGLSHFVGTLPNGLDTKLDDNTAVSVGQKQLLTIARAMVQNCPMLILDEATSSVDTRTEIVIQNAMDKLTKNRTSFVIAHRLSTIKNADVIIVMNEGKIIETGNHKKLLEKGGFYTNLYNSQFSK